MRNIFFAGLLLLLAGCGGTSGHVQTLKNSPDAEKRAQAAKALGERGPSAQDAVPALLAAFNDDGRYLGSGILFWKQELYVRDEVAKALVKIGGTDTVSGLCRFLSSDDYMVASRAAGVLQDMGASAKDALPQLLATLEQSNQGEVLKASMGAVEAMGLQAGTPLAQQAIPILKRNFQKVPLTWIDLRLRATRIFRQIAPDDLSPIPSLIDVLADDRSRLNYEVAAVLTQFGDKAVLPLIQALGSQKDSVRWSAEQFLAKLPPEQTMNALQQALADPDARLRAESAKTLGLIGTGAKAAAPALQQRLTDKDSLVRIEAARAMWILTRDVPSTFPVFVSGLQDKSEPARYAAQQTLKQIGPKDDWAVDTLMSYLKEKPYQKQAAIVLGQIGPAARKAMPLLLAALDDPDQEYRLEVAKALSLVDAR
ncbi:MAG TPA: HEAT repeat domain-containing protein [Gemmatales bacterium]|nr:HEAT repeat domain-containing protein [Gemmatales bacterium]